MRQSILLCIGLLTTGTLAQAPAPDSHALLPLAEVTHAPTDPPPTPPPSIEASPDAQRLYEAARARFEDGRLNDAFPLLQQALQAAPQPYFETQYLQAQLLFASGQLDAALTTLKKALSLRPDSTD